MKPSSFYTSIALLALAGMHGPDARSAPHGGEPGCVPRQLEAAIQDGKRADPAWLQLGALPEAPDPKENWYRLRWESKYSVRTDKWDATGTLEAFEIVPGYRVLQMKTLEGEILLLDPAEMNLQGIWSAPQGTPSLAASGKRFGDRSPLRWELDARRLKAHLCSLESQVRRRPEYDAIRRIIDERHRHSPVALAESLVRCPVAFAAYNSLQRFMRETQERRDRKKEGTWMELHGSNFIRGLALMTLTHNCLSAPQPNRRNQFLALTLGLNVAGNIWEEIQIPGVDQRSLPFFNSDGRPVRTDLEDFQSGMMATLVYLTAAKSLDRLLAYPFTRMCAGNRSP